MTQKCHLQISLRAMKLPSELLFELTRNRAFEPNFEGTVFSHFKGSLFNRELKHFGKGSFRLFKSKMAWNFSSVFDLDCLLDGLVDENVAKIYFLLSQVSLWTKSFTLEFKWKPFFGARNVAIRHTVVGTGSDGHESNGDCNLRVRPNLANERFNSEDFILEEEEIVFDGFSDGLILSGEGEFCPFSFPFKVFSVIKFFLGR
jgi:hypothetical protein